MDNDCWLLWATPFDRVCTNYRKLYYACTAFYHADPSPPLFVHSWTKCVQILCWLRFDRRSRETAQNFELKLHRWIPNSYVDDWTVVTSQYLLGTLGMAICFLSNTTLPLYHARRKLYSFSIHPNVNIIDQLYPFNKICLTTKGDT